MQTLEQLFTHHIRDGRGDMDAHFQAWIRELRRHPDQLRDAQDATKRFLLETSFTRSLVGAGVTMEHGFFKELRVRTMNKFFPPIYEDRDLTSMLGRMEAAGAPPDALLNLSSSTMGELFSVLTPEDPKLPAAMRPRLAEAMGTIAIRIAAQGLSRQIFDRLNEQQHRSTFLNLPRVVTSYVEQRTSQAYESLLKAVDVCVSACKAIRQKRATEGISLDLTFRLIMIQDNCHRIRKLARIHWGLVENLNPRAVEDLLREILHAQVRTPAIGGLFSRYLSLVFFQITEHTGKTGEKYIARNSAGYFKMARKGLIGGAIVGGLALTKPWASLLHLAPVPEATAYGLIYSFIFLLIYFVGGVLATKQPAMTASHIAYALDKARASQTFIWQLSDLVMHTFRTQTVAVLGNFVLALPVAYLVYTGLLSLGWNGLPGQKVTYLVQSLHPFKSLTIFHAAVTGFILSMSGIFAGAATNWFVYNKVGRRMEKLLSDRERLEAGKAHTLSRWLNHNISYLVGNVSLGVALGAVPIVGDVFGLPLDVRHITFTSAQLGSALAHFGTLMPWHEFGWAIAGVLLTGAINLAVSFGLTLYLVLKSRNINFEMQGQLAKLCLKRILRNPFILVFPIGGEREDAPPNSGEPQSDN